MITLTFDLTAFIVGVVLGMIIGGFVVFFEEMRDGGAWSKGFNDGFDLKCNLRDVKNILTKLKEDRNHDVK